MRSSIPALLVVVLSSAALAMAAPDLRVCVEAEAKQGCPIDRVRMCATNGTFATCQCPPGASASASGSPCLPDPSAKPPPLCVVPDALLGKTLGAALDVGSLAIPPLPTITKATSSETIAALEGKAGLSVAELSRLAIAHEDVEGGAAYEASLSKGAKAKALEARRDGAVDRAIAVRRLLLDKGSTGVSVDHARLALARSLLRRAAYRGTQGGVDREAANAALDSVIKSGASPLAVRDAAFLAGEGAARELAWAKVVSFEEEVVKRAAAKTELDDVAYLAAAHARLAQAQLFLSDLPRARVALEKTLVHAYACGSRLECVSSATAARSVIAGAWAASGLPARSLVPVLRKGTMPLVARVRPLHQLAELYAAAKASTCAAAAEEARAWVQVVH